MQDKESQLLKAYFKIVVGPFQEKYEDMWEEEAYWEAVEAFKAESKKIGFEDPCEALNLTSFEIYTLIAYRTGTKAAEFSLLVEQLPYLLCLIDYSSPTWKINTVVLRFEYFSKAIRARLMAGPMLCFRKGWKSPFIGEEVDMLTLIERFHHTSGPKFEGKERIVIIEFWAKW